MDCWPVQTALGFSPDISSDEHQWQQMDELTLTKLAIWLLGFISVYIQLKSYPIDTIFPQSLAEEPACVLTQRLLWKQTTMSIYTTQDRWKKITSLKTRLQSQGALTDTCLRIWGQQFSPKWSVQSSKISACMLTERHSASPLIQGFLVLHGSDFKGNEASSNLNTQLDFAQRYNWLCSFFITAHYFHCYVVTSVFRLHGVKLINLGLYPCTAPIADLLYVSHLRGNITFAIITSAETR